MEMYERVSIDYNLNTYYNKYKYGGSNTKNNLQFYKSLSPNITLCEQRVSARILKTTPSTRIT